MTTNDPLDQVRAIIDPAGEIPPTKEALLKRVEEMIEASKNKPPVPPRQKKEEGKLRKMWLIWAAAILLVGSALYFVG